MKNICFVVDGMKCGGCTSKIEKAFENMNEVSKTDISLEDKTVKVSFEDLSPMTLKKTIEELGFSVSKMSKCDV